MKRMIGKYTSCDDLFCVFIVTKLNLVSMSMREKLYEGIMKLMMHRSRWSLFEFFCRRFWASIGGFYFTYQDETRRVSDKNAMGSDENAFSSVKYPIGDASEVVLVATGMI
jgi:hypothetical protein